MKKKGKLCLIPIWGPYIIIFFLSFQLSIKMKYSTFRIIGWLFLVTPFAFLGIMLGMLINDLLDLDNQMALYGLIMGLSMWPFLCIHSLIYLRYAKRIEELRNDTKPRVADSKR